MFSDGLRWPLRMTHSTPNGIITYRLRNAGLEEAVKKQNEVNIEG